MAEIKDKDIISQPLKLETPPLSFETFITQQNNFYMYFLKNTFCDPFRNKEHYLKFQQEHSNLNLINTLEQEITELYSFTMKKSSPLKDYPFYKVVTDHKAALSINYVLQHPDLHPITEKLYQAYLSMRKYVSNEKEELFN